MKRKWREMGGIGKEGDDDDMRGGDREWRRIREGQRRDACEILCFYFYIIYIWYYMF
jgi:hypothetical protein